MKGETRCLHESARGLVNGRVGKTPLFAASVSFQEYICTGVFTEVDTRALVVVGGGGDEERSRVSSQGGESDT